MGTIDEMTSKAHDFRSRTVQGARADHGQIWRAAPSTTRDVLGCQRISPHRTGGALGPTERVAIALEQNGHAHVPLTRRECARLRQGPDPCPDR